MSKLIRNIVFIFIGLTLSFCAIQMAPTGGEVDKIPPEIIEYFPLNKTINFKENYFEITFSEYVDKRSVREAIFISPNITGDVEYDWSGKTLEVTFEKDSLKTNTTYVVSIGTDVKDLNNKNNMAESFIFSFSTGDKIDYGSISGKVYDKEPQGTFVFAYRQDTSKFDPSNIKPDYLSQVGEKGNYKLMGLAKGTYRLLAVKDKFKNYLYDIDEDLYGFTYKDIFISETDTIFNNIDFQLTKADTSIPHLMTATMTDRAHILIEFSEAVDSSKLKKENFEIIDSTDIKSQKVDFVYKGKSKNNELFIAFSDSLSEENVYHLFVNNFEDKFGNINKSESISFAVNTDPDTTPVKLSKFVTGIDQNLVDNLKPSVEFEFIDGFDQTNLKSAITIEDQNKRSFNYNLFPLDDAKFRIELPRKLKAKTQIDINIDFAKLPDAIGNIDDSVCTYKFTAIDGLEFSGASGKVKSSSKNAVVNLDEINKSEIYTVVSKEEEFNFERVKPGKYFLWAFDDNDSNKVLSRGDILNNKLGERFYYYPDTLNLRARWPVGKILLNSK